MAAPCWSRKDAEHLCPLPRSTGWMQSRQKGIMLQRCWSHRQPHTAPATFTPEEGRAPLLSAECKAAPSPAQP